MKFREIFRFEFVYQLSRIWPWLFFIVSVVLNFLMTRDATLSEALYEDFLVNSPFAIAKTMVFGGFIWLMAAAVIAGDAASRDQTTRMHALTYSAPVTKTQYLGGKFFAAVAVNLVILLGIPIGIILATYSPGVDAAIVGPFNAKAYLTAFAYIILPNAFFATAIQFSLASWTGRAMAAYVGSIMLFFLGFFVAGFILFKRGLGTLIDPIGIRFIVEDLSHLWTTSERNFRYITLDGTLLVNRMLWVSAGVAFLVITYFHFQLEHRTSWTLRWFRKKDLADSSKATFNDTSAISIPKVKRTFGFILHSRQILRIAWESFRAIAFSKPGLALLILIPLLTIPVVLDQMISDSVPIVPTTTHVLRELTAPLSAELSRWVIIPLLIIFFEGELVWRERENRLGEITQTLPGSEWAPLLGKFIGLVFVLCAFTALQMAGGMAAQLIDGYDNVEIGLYIKVLFGLQLTDYVLFALLVMVIHVIIDQKYIAHMVALVAYAFIALSSLFGVEHNLLVFTGSPEWSYTDMRGFGNTLGPWAWFKLYWAAWALLFAVAAKVLWIRGNESSFRLRLRMARQRFTGATIVTAVVAISLIVFVGGFIFYNTNILNSYYTADENKERQALYEKRYGQYGNAAQPHVSAVKLSVDIFPETSEVKIEGSYSLINKNSVAVDSIHIATPANVTTSIQGFDRKATLAVEDQDLHHIIYTLDEALMPGDSIQLNFRLDIKPKGFRESGINVSIAENGTNFGSGAFPAIGYQSSRELIMAADRREFGLEARPVIPSLYDSVARAGISGGIDFEAIVSTTHDQVGVAPGKLVRNWKTADRNYFHYTTNAPIGSEWAFFSARYSVHEASWTSTIDSRAVAIRIFHHPEHTAHLNWMIRSITASLDYYTKEFGPYRYGHLTVVEAPGAGTGIHADPSILTYTEGATRWKSPANEQQLDFPYAVMAHEVAHQWTVPYAFVEGAPVMSESVAWYYAMKAVEHTRGKNQLDRLRAFMRQPHPYAPIRRGEPLLRGLDPYMSYRKGPFALYTLSEYVGEQSVNKALRTLLEKHRSEGARVATTLDLFAELKQVTPDSLQYLLHDLFEVNTFWELVARKAVAKTNSEGSWQVTIEVDSKKEVTDSSGGERDVAMDDWVGMAVYSEDENIKTPIYEQKHRIRSGKQTITITVNERPGRAAIDPDFLLVDLTPENNSCGIAQ